METLLIITKIISGVGLASCVFKISGFGCCYAYESGFL